MGHDPQGHHRQSIRLPGYDYRQAGWYFVTLVTVRRDCLFLRNDMREAAEGLFVALPDHFPRLKIDEWVLMPNQLHAILVLTGSPDPEEVCTPSGGVSSGSLGAVIGNYKSVSTRRLNRVMGGFAGRQIWQRGYYEHIIRSEIELSAIREYIRRNPANWELDAEYSTHAL